MHLYINTKACNRGAGGPADNQIAVCAASAVLRLPFKRKDRPAGLGCFI